MTTARKKSRKELASAVLWNTAWLSLIVFGFALIEKFETTSGPALARQKTAVSPSPYWPSTSKIAFKGPTLLMFVHPQCPCSKTSVAELRTILPKLKEINTCIVVFSPPDENWDSAQLLEPLRGEAQIVVYRDESGKAASDFGATTSGEFLFYGANKKLLFAGGITRARGQEGNSAYLDVLQAAIGGSEKHLCQTPVYGCALADNPAPLSEVVESWTR